MKNQPSYNLSVCKPFNPITKYLMLLLLTWMVSEHIVAQSLGRIVIPDVSVSIGESMLPVNIDNTDEIVAVQFDIDLPEVEYVYDAAVLTERCDGHQTVIRALGGNVYRVILYSESNHPLRGQSGTVMNIPIVMSDRIEPGSEFAITISNAVLSKASGENVLTEVQAGTIRIDQIPDLTVKDIAIDQREITPGGTMSVSYQVENVGDVATTGGWTEQLSLVNYDESEEVHVASLYHSEPLEAGGVVSRQAEVALPTLLGIYSACRLQVKIVGGSETGEPISALGNNTQLSDNFVIVDRVMGIELSPNKVEEDADTRIALKLWRSGGWNENETFQLKTTTDSRLSLPQSITIPQGQSAATLFFRVTDNDVADENDHVLISALSNGGVVAKDTLWIEDDELPQLTLTASKSVVTEGEKFTLTVATSRPSGEAIPVTLTVDNGKRFSYPTSVVIPAGKTSVTFEVQTVNDEIPSMDLSCLFTASALRHAKGETIVILQDDDMPVLQLELTPGKVGEGAGPLAVTGTLRRLSNTDKKVTVRLSDDSAGGLYFDRSVIELPKGAEEASFSFGPVDNTVVDGDRTYTITAGVWLSSCSCSAAGQSAGAVEATLQVLDDDGPALALTSQLSTVKEGESTTLIVSRNNSSAKALTVTLSSDYDSDLSYNHQLTIPAGQTSAQVKVSSLKNNVKGDSHTVVFTASANGYASGTCWLLVTDQTLPDARISSFALSAGSVAVNQSVEATVEVENSGAAILEAPVRVNIYEKDSTTILATLYTSKDLAVGQKEQLKQTVDAFTTVGEKRLYARINEQQKTEELLYTNNVSPNVTLQVESPFANVTVATDRKSYQQGQTVTFTGRIANAPQQDVEVYWEGSGLRQSVVATTDGEGRFTAQFIPAAAQSGHFIAGACYPGENMQQEMCAFDIYGMKVVATGYLTFETLVEQPYTDGITIRNTSSLPLTQIVAEVVDNPADCDVTIQGLNRLAGGAEATIGLTLNGHSATEGNDWRPIKVRLRADEGCTTDVTLYYYCRTVEGHLQASIQRLDATMNRDAVREYPFTVSNTGEGETGEIALVLPAWMKSANATRLPSLKKGEEATVVLRLTPTDEMQLNVPVTGFFSLNCANGNSITIPYSVETVSETTGSLTVDVCDQYTYYTEEAPHVAGATVYVKHPTTDAIVAQGATGTDGTYSIRLNEGYYKLEVTAEKHDFYSNFCYVNPGRDTRQTVNISYQPITISWNVEETEVEDEYQIETIVQYETNVPMPVVKVELPKSIDGDNMAVGDATLIHMVLTNLGLIRAENVRLALPTLPTEFSFEALDYTEPFTLDPQQSVRVPILIRRVADESGQQQVRRKDFSGDFYNGFNNCMAGMGSLYDVMCGDTLKNNAAAERMALKACAMVAPMYAIMEALSNFIGGAPTGPGGSGGGGGGGAYGDIGEVTKTLDICDPCDAEKAERIIDKLVGHTWLSLIWDAINKVIEKYQKERDTSNLKFVVKTTAGDIVKEGGVELMNHYKENLGTMGGYIIEVWEVVKPCEDEKKQDDDKKDKAPRKAAKHGWAEEFENVTDDYVNQLEAVNQLIEYVFGDRIWFDEMDQEKMDFMEWVIGLPDGYTPTDEELMARRPASVTLAQMRAFVNHQNGTGQNMPTLEQIEEKFDIFSQAEKQAREKGFDSMIDLYYDAYDTYRQHYEDMHDGSVCASISMKFSQQMVMTRQAFRGTLTVFNGHDDLPMRDVRLNLVVKDPDGNIATQHEFQVNAESIDTFGGNLSLTGGWTLDAQRTGTATVLFIPTKFAAPTAPVSYSFGGSLTYIDPYTGLEVTRDLYPVTLTVNPSPVLDLTYFMQRDVYGDDPFTAAVEPKQPAEFALVINNKGYGDATNVSMTTQQPEIIDNEKGLLIDFEIVSSQVNGQPSVLTFGQAASNQFGTIPAHSQAYAQWWLESSLLGHFTSYDVSATHLTSYGNEDLSLLDQVTIHELIHGFSVPTGGQNPVRGFLVNDVADANDMPDTLYFSNATQEHLSLATDASLVAVGDSQYELTIQPSEAGWNYGSLLSPLAGRQQLVSVVRKSDGSTLPTDNVWTTDRTLIDGKDWLYENRIHFVGDMKATGETLILTFEPMADQELGVRIQRTDLGSLKDADIDNPVLTAQMETVAVNFNRGINAATFTTDDLQLTYQGEKVSLDGVNIEQVTDRLFMIDLSKVTTRSGYYMFSVQTAGIQDKEGFSGSAGKQVSWMQYVDGKVNLNITVQPAEGGTVTPASGRLAYDKDVTLKAKAAKGYDFSCWKRGSAVAGTNPTLVVHPLGDEELTAEFAIRYYNVNISFDPQEGIVEDAASGIYPHGTELSFHAVPLRGFEFDGWYIDGNRRSGSDTYRLTVESETCVEALFRGITTGEKPLQDALSVSLYPLPLREWLHVDGNFGELRRVELYDVRGTLQLSRMGLTGGQGIFVGQLPPGIYLTVVTTDRGLYRAKILKR